MNQVVFSVEKRRLRGPSGSLQLPDSRVQLGWSLLPGEKDERKQPQVVQREVEVGDQGKCLTRKSGQALEHSAKGSGGFTIPGSFQKTCGCVA